MSPTARPAERSDLAELERLLVLSRAETVSQRGGVALTASRPAASEQARLALDDPESMVWCAMWEGAVVGCAIATRSQEGDETIVTLTELYTDVEARDIGVGETLVEAAIAWAIASEATAIDALALPGARAAKNLYERLGMTARLITVRRELD